LETPHFDRLAAAGMRFDRAFVASPACAPSRGALLTGLMPARNGAESNHTYPHDRFFPGFVGVFQSLGYEVASFGKIAHGGEEHKVRWGWDHLERKYDAETVREYLVGPPVRSSRSS
jgi:N-sulfoglucosamine sulfohydrolase